jgi:hypothetical protein
LPLKSKKALPEYTDGIGGTIFPKKNNPLKTLMFTRVIFSNDDG